MQEKQKENSSCSACRHSLQDMTHLLLDCPASEPLWCAIFGTTSIFDLWSKPWDMASVEFLHAPISRKGLGSTTTRCGSPAWRKTCKQNSFCVGVIGWIDELFHVKSLNGLKGGPMGKNCIVKKFEKFFWTQCKNFRLKIPYRYREIVKKIKKIYCLLIGRKFYDIRDHVRSKSFYRF